MKTFSTCVLCLLFILIVAAVMTQQAAPPLDPIDMITIKVIPGVHAVIEASNERVTLQHTKGKTLIFIDTRPASQIGKP